MKYTDRLSSVFISNRDRVWSVSILYKNSKKVFKKNKNFEVAYLRDLASLIS